MHSRCILFRPSLRISDPLPDCGDVFLVVLTLAINSSSVAGFVFLVSGVEDFDCFPIKLSKAEAALLFPDFAGLSRSVGVKTKTKSVRIDGMRNTSSLHQRG